jgi:histone H3/H4
MSGHQDKESKKKVELLKNRIIARRHDRQQGNTKLTDAAIKKLGHRAGVPTFGKSSGIYDLMRKVIGYDIDQLLQAVIIMTKHAGRKTVSKDDVKEVLRLKGRTLYSIL